MVDKVDEAMIEKIESLLSKASDFFDDIRESIKKEKEDFAAFLETESERIRILQLERFQGEKDNLAAFLEIEYEKIKLDFEELKNEEGRLAAEKMAIKEEEVLESEQGEESAKVTQKEKRVRV